MVEKQLVLSPRFWLFSRSTTLLLGAVAITTNLLVVPCGAIKELKTRYGAEFPDML